MKTERKGDWARIIPQGSINITNAEKLGEGFQKIIRSDVNKIILDMKNVDDMDSAAMGKILVTNSTLIKKDGKLVIENINSEYVKKVFEAVHLADVIEIRD